MKVLVESAIKLTSSQISSLEKKLTVSLGSKVTISNSIDPRVIGGLRIVTPQKTIDLTLAAKLNQLKQNLLKN